MFDSLRRFLARRHRAGLVAAATCVVVAAGIVAWTFRPIPRSPEVKAYFVDEDTGAESVHPWTDIPPLAGAAGKPTLVRGVYFTCDGGRTRTLAYLEKFTGEAKGALEKAIREDHGRIPPGVLMGAESGHLIRGPDKGDPWVLNNSPEGQKLRRSVRCPAGGHVTICRPGINS